MLPDVVLMILVASVEARVRCVGHRPRLLHATSESSVRVQDGSARAEAPAPIPPER